MDVIFCMLRNSFRELRMEYSTMKNNSVLKREHIIGLYNETMRMYDSSLVEHGERVAYIAYLIMERLPKNDIDLPYCVCFMILGLIKPRKSIVWLNSRVMMFLSIRCMGIYF